MDPTTDRRPPRPAPARRSKVAASALSAGAVLAIVTGLTATAHDRQVAPNTTVNSGGSPPATGTIQPARPAAATVVPAPIPAPAPAQTATAVPDGVSKASGG